MKLLELFDENMMPNWEKFNELFPEMATCHHSKRWHKEGSPLQHTKLVVNEMYKHSHGNVDTIDYLIIISAALLHDIGKPSTTYWNEKEQDWCCKSHGEAGERIFRNMFRDEDIMIREKVAYLIRYHMVLNNILHKNKKKQKKDMMFLKNGNVPFSAMLILHECDIRGSVNDENNEEFIKKHLEEINKLERETNEDKWSYFNEDSRIVFVMIGVAGSGKTTFAKKSNVPIVSRDAVRVELGYCKEGEKFLGNNEQEKKVTEIVDKRIKELAESDKCFIIDNTSLKKKYRNQYANLYEKYNIVPIFVYVEAPSMEENKKRREGQIDGKIIENMWSTMEFPTKDECFSLLIVDPESGVTKPL